MFSTQAFRIITHLSKIVSAEEQKFLERDQQYTREFQKSFQNEQKYLLEKRVFSNEFRQDKRPPSRSIIKKHLLKKIYRKLAIKTHPDMYSGDGLEFNVVRMAYEREDTPALLAESLKHDVQLSLVEDDITDMMKDIQLRRSEIEHRKNTLRWVWGECKRGDRTRKLIRAALQIDEIKFQRWQSSRKR